MICIWYTIYYIYNILVLLICHGVAVLCVVKPVPACVRAGMCREDMHRPARALRIDTCIDMGIDICIDMCGIRHASGYGT